MMNQTAQIAGEKKLKLVVFRGVLALSGRRVSVDISRQLWYSPSNCRCKTNRNIFSFSYVEICEHELYIRGLEDFSNEKYKEGVWESKRVVAFYSRERAERGFGEHKQNLHDAATWAADNFMSKFR